MLRTALVAALVVALAGMPPGAPSAAATDAYGHTAAADRTLRPGCHNYRYRYVVKAPTDDWTLETFLTDPGGDRVGSGGFFAESDPRRGRSAFRLCRYATRPGRFTIRAKLVWYDGSEAHIVRFKATRFRLRRP
jgi:hypothetical protein